MLVTFMVSVATASADPVGDPVPSYAFDPAFASPGNCGSAYVEYSGTEDSGGSLLVWLEPRAGTERGSMIRAALVDNDGALLDTPVDVSVEQPSRSISACNGNPTVTAGPDGEFLILWGHELPNYDEEIAGQIINPDGTRQGTNFIASDAHTDILVAEAAWGSDDNRYLISLDEDGATQERNVGSFIDRDGARIGSEFVLLPPSETGWPDVAYGSGLWTASGMYCSPQPCRGPYAVTESGSGSPSADFLIPPSLEISNSFGTSIAYNDFTNEFLVVWSRQTAGNVYNHFAMRLNSAGTPVGSLITIDTGDGPHPRVAAGGEDGYLVTWHDWSGTYYVVASQLGTDGQPIGVPETVSLPNTDASSYRPSVTYAKDTGCYVVAWNGNGNPNNPFTPPTDGANVWTRNWNPTGSEPCVDPPTPNTPTIRAKGKAGATKLRVKVECGGTAPCEIRLTGKEKGRKGKLVPKTVQVGANGKVVTLRYTGALERSLLERGGGKVRVTASQTGGGSATTTVLVRVFPSPVTG